MRQHMVKTLKHLKLITDKVNWAILRENGVLLVSKMTETPLPVSQLLPKASSKKKATYQWFTQVMGLIWMHIS